MTYNGSSGTLNPAISYLCSSFGNLTRGVSYSWCMLDQLRPTATGLDAVPAWFLRLGAPVFAAPIAELFNQSLIAGVVPHQWKTAIITPVPKIPRPMQPKDFRPISISPVLSRVLEKYVVRSYLYPALHQAPAGLTFADQFAFRPTGSTVAALIALLHTVHSKLSTNDYVHVFTLDFTKAFDTVRHATTWRKCRTSLCQIKSSTG